MAYLRLMQTVALGRVALGVFLSSQGFPIRPSRWMTKVTVLLLTSIPATFMFGSPVSKNPLGG